MTALSADILMSRDPHPEKTRLSSSERKETVIGGKIEGEPFEILGFSSFLRPGGLSCFLPVLQSANPLFEGFKLLLGHEIQVS